MVEKAYDPLARAGTLAARGEAATYMICEDTLCRYIGDGRAGVTAVMMHCPEMQQEFNGYGVPPLAFRGVCKRVQPEIQSPSGAFVSESAVRLKAAVGSGP